MPSEGPGTSSAPDVTGAEPLDRRALSVASVLVVGGLMVVLDTTVMNVAIGRLSQELDASLPVIQWVTTGYTLALATVIPVMAWAVARLGAKRLYLLALALFIGASMLAGLAWNVQTLIAFRVLQGLGGGLIVPVAMTIALRAAPRSQRGRIMGILGIPVLIGPIAGPVLGGWILDTLSWRWIFFINLPVGLLAIALAARVLHAEPPSESRPLDIAGLLMLSPGLAALIYGLASAGEQGAVATPAVLVPALAGAGLLVGFVVRALTLTNPLVDIGLLRLKPLASGAAVLALFATAYFGSLFLVPLYFQVVRGESATVAGLVGIPQALATGISMQVASRLVDRVPVGRVVAVGIGLATAGFVAFTTQLAADTSYWVLLTTLAVAGAGVGATLMPTMTAATRYLDHDDLSSGTTLLNITNQVAVSFGTAATSVMLGSALSSRLAAGDGVAELYGLPAQDLVRVADLLAGSFQVTYLLPITLMAASLAVALLLLPRKAGPPEAPKVRARRRRFGGRRRRTGPRR